MNEQQCHWCGGRFGVHSDRCDVPKRLKIIDDARAKARAAADRTESGVASLASEVAR